MTSEIQFADAHEWVRTVILPRIQRTEDNSDYLFPDPYPDFDSFSRLHSWYKHFSEMGKVYPMLRHGETSRNMFCQTKDDGKLHWCFVHEQDIYGDENVSKQIPWTIIRDHSLHLSTDLSSFSTNKDTPSYKASIYYLKCLELEVGTIMEQIRRILWEVDPNPPTNRTLIYCRKLDGRKVHAPAALDQKVSSPPTFSYKRYEIPNLDLKKIML